MSPLHPSLEFPVMVMAKVGRRFAVRHLSEGLQPAYDVKLSRESRFKGEWLGMCASTMCPP
jgi:hypothetical protein